MNSKRFLIISRQPPYGASPAREALDAALTSAAFGQQVSLLFMDDGVYQLLDQQQPDALEAKNLSSMLSALPLYDVDQVYVDRTSLDERGLCPDSFTIPAKVLGDDEVAALLQAQDQLLSF